MTAPWLGHRDLCGLQWHEPCTCPGGPELLAEQEASSGLNVLSLFAGVGGLELGLERAGLTTVGQVEIDPYCNEVLARHWPEVPRHDDVRTAPEWWEREPRPRVDVVCGGPPCQPFSDLGLGLGVGDDRWGWPWMADVVRAVGPRYVVVENVPGLLRDADAFGWILGDLHKLGFDAEWSVVSACFVGAPHPRERVFLVAYPAGHDGEQPLHLQAAVQDGRAGTGTAGRDARPDRWLSEPGFRRMAHGVPTRMDQERLNASTTEAGPTEALPGMRQGALSVPHTEGPAGRPVGIQEAEVLRSNLHGEGVPERRPDRHVHAEVSEAILRELWEHIAVGGSPQGRGSDEQLTRELADSLRQVPHLPSLEDREATLAAQRYMQGLREACTQAGLLRDASLPLSPAWQSLSRDEADWVHLAACRGPWVTEWPNSPRVAHGFPKQLVARGLHALGNAVVPQVAEFVGRLIVNHHQLTLTHGGPQ